MNSGGSGRTCWWPGATMLAPRNAWKYSVPPSERFRVEQRGQWILREQKCSVPSSAINTRPSRRRNGSSTPSVGDRFEEQRIERRRWGTIQHLADIGVSWNGGHAEQGLAIRPAVSLFQRALMAQERRASHEEHRERREADIGHGVFAVTAWPFALVREAGANAFQLSDQGLQHRHAAIESKIVPRRQAKSSSVQGKDAKIHELLLGRTHPDCCDQFIGVGNRPDGPLNNATHSHLELLTKDPRPGHGSLPRRERLGEHEHREACGTRHRIHKGPGNARAGSRSAFIDPAKSGNRARRDPTEEREARNTGGTLNSANLSTRTTDSRPGEAAARGGCIR